MPHDDYNEISSCGRNNVVRFVDKTDMFVLSFTVHFTYGLPPWHLLVKGVYTVKSGQDIITHIATKRKQIATAPADSSYKFNKQLLTLSVYPLTPPLSPSLSLNLPLSLSLSLHLSPLTL